MSLGEHPFLEESDRLVKVKIIEDTKDQYARYHANIVELQEHFYRELAKLVFKEIKDKIGEM